MKFPLNFPQPNETYYKASLEILSKVKEDDITNRADLKETVRTVSKKYRIGAVPLWTISWSYNHQEEIELSAKNLEVLVIKRVRSLSGIVSLSVFTKPYACPGNCVFCPTETEIPKSYLSDEPAVMRAVRNEYDPARQVVSRLNQLKFSGHQPDKIELIIQGGTFSNLPQDYREEFVAQCYKAVNDWPQTIEGSADLEAEISRNEAAANRIVGLTVETRPDWINEKEVLFLRKLGVTRLEMGVQSTDDEILALSNRGHLTQRTIEATRLLKDAGFKICYHIMPGLPGSTPEKDLAMIEGLFQGPAYQPDLLKVYPCVVTRNSELENRYREGKFRPLSDKELTELLIVVKKIIPPYVRIQRLGRDIPATDIVAGSKVSNIRQIVLDKHKARCRCIRCREAGGREVNNPELEIVEYEASEGREYFLQFVNPENEMLYALLRLRLPSPATIFGTLSGAAIIREVHTYGRLTEIGLDGPVQHQGLGKRLVQKAEEIARKAGRRRVAVISGVGVREYYQKLGYRLEETYMVKEL